MKKCFTINPSRTAEDFESYRPLLVEGVYRAIEIFYPYHFEPKKQAAYTENVKNLKRDFPAVEIVLHLPHGPANDLGNFEKATAVMKVMKDGVDYGASLGATKLTLHLGYMFPGATRAEALSHCEEVLSELAEYARKRDMYLMIENMPGPSELGYAPGEIKTLIERVGAANLKFILDTGHAHLSEYDIGEYIDILAPYLYHTHFSDNDGSGDRHGRLGSGTIDFYGVLKKLRKIGYNELYCLEIIFETAADLYRNAADLDKYDI
ncbi:MAG: sugar phosphate isomerase/epimerase [Acholeplasmataceae bacterium]|nr:sugar phosphate isomerase/epimerase [Acholeplasmataceae bacterium]